MLFGQVVAEDWTRRSISPKMACILFRVVLSSHIGQGLFYMVERLMNTRQMGSLSSCRCWRQPVCCICKVTRLHVNMRAKALAHVSIESQAMLRVGIWMHLDFRYSSSTRRSRSYFRDTGIVLDVYFFR